MDRAFSCKALGSISAPIYSMYTSKTHTQDLDVSRAPHGKFGGHELAAGGWTGGSSMVGMDGGDIADTAVFSQS